MKQIWLAVALGLVAIISSPAGAQPMPVPSPLSPPPATFGHVQSIDEAYGEDAAQYAARYGVPAEEAVRRLRIQEESVAATDAIRAEFRDRLAGIAIEHEPDFHIQVLLTGEAPVAGRRIAVGRTTVPVLFQAGARATQDQLVAALRQNQAVIADAVPKARGMGIDQRAGQLVLLVRPDLADDADMVAAEAMLGALTGVPVRIGVLDTDVANTAIEGGGRVQGVDPANGKLYACTTGFVVADGTRTGVVTAAHCPDALSYVGTNGEQLPLTYVDAWGARYQDVQLHVSDAPLQPQFFVDRVKGVTRPLTGQRMRASTRSGDYVCHRGESSGYSCALVELTDFAPPGDLCAGPCEPVWVSVEGPTCRGGDSGGPIFLGTTAFGIVKGASYAPDGRCTFYFYMSTDYLPEGWSLLFDRPATAPRTAAAAF